MAYTFEVDFDVYKAIFSRRADESITENDVLRELLGLPNSAQPADHPQTRSQVLEASSPEDWISKGVRFPKGTDFRAKYKGRDYAGRVQGGSLVVDGKSYDSPSAAAVAITGNNVNGWRFWECRVPGKQAWQSIEAVRR